jgi:hypothetical protein
MIYKVAFYLETEDNPEFVPPLSCLLMCEPHAGVKVLEVVIDKRTKVEAISELGTADHFRELERVPV